MAATVIVGMLCTHLMCYAVLLLLISRRLQGPKLGMDVFSLASFFLGVVYVFQLLEGEPGWSWMSVANHSLMFCAILAYFVGGMRFFGRPARLLLPLLIMASGYTVAQFVVQEVFGLMARYAMLSAFSALLFFSMTLVLIRGINSFAKDLRIEAIVFVGLIGGLGLLNAIKCLNILFLGEDALEMDSPFQIAFYIYMSLMATVLAPTLVWMVLRRLTDALRETAARDPLTQLLNRRGLAERLQAYFRLRTAKPAYLLIADIDYFKRINDTHGHQAGDTVLCEMAGLLHETSRQGDFASRTGGEEFVIVCLETDTAGAVSAAERLRLAMENKPLVISGVAEPVRCTVTLGVSDAFSSVAELDRAIQQADAALYRGKALGRNRVEWHQSISKRLETVASPAAESLSVL